MVPAPVITIQLTTKRYRAGYLFCGKGTETIRLSSPIRTIWLVFVGHSFSSR